MFKEVLRRWLSSATKSGGDKATDVDSEASTKSGRWSFHARPHLLDASDRQLFRLLTDAVADLAIVCPKTRVADVVSVAGAEKMSGAAMIDRKTIDFLICDGESFQPLVAVQVDRWKEGKQELRDQYVEQALISAELAVVRISSNQFPSAAELRERLGPVIAQRRRMDSASSSVPPPSGIGAETQRKPDRHGAS